MLPSNDPCAHGRLASLAALLAASSLLLSGACSRPESASLERDVRIEVSHQPPGDAPADTSFLLGIHLSATPPPAPGSAQLWVNQQGEWARLDLVPLAGTDRFEAELPPQPRGRILRYYFTVRSALGETLRLPAAASTSVPDGRSRRAAETYTLHVRGPVASWAAWLRGGGAALALVLVAAGTFLLVRRREGQGEQRGRTAVALAGLGTAVFAALALGGAVAVSFQATGNLLREVPPAWWIALLLWLPLLLVAWRARGRPAGPGGRGLGLWMPALAVLGALAVLVGTRDLL